MAKMDHVPLPAVRRLSIYLRQLECLQAADRQTVSSKALGAALGISDVQIRKDLAYFGQFGHPGVGYRVPELMRRVRRILGTDRTSKVLLVGAGNLGRALVAFRGFAEKGFEIVAVFDSNPDKIGRAIDGAVNGPRQDAKVRDLSSHQRTIQHPSQMAAAVRAGDIRIGILAVPAEAAQGVANEMASAGIRAVLNFAPATLQVPEHVAVASVDLAVHLEQLSFQASYTGP